MTAKSILEIEVNAQAFQRYQQLFSRYQDQLAKHPGLWKKISGETNATAGTFNRMAAAAQAHARVQREMSEIYKAQNRNLIQGDRLWGSMASHAKTIGSTILSTTRTLLSWAGILGGIGGVLGGGSFLGIDRMARSAADSRRSSMGLGVSIGEQSAFRVNYGRAVDSDSFLSWVAQMESDPRKAAAASATGVGLTGHTGADAAAMVRAIRARAQSYPASIRGMLPEMFRWEGVSGEDVRRLATMSDQEFGGLEKGFRSDSKNLNIQDKTAEAWTDFVKRLDEAKSSIFATFVQGLLPLRQPLQHLSSAFQHFLEHLMRSDVIKHSIDNLATWLDKLGKAIDSPEFETNLSKFIAGIGEMADGIGDLMHDIQNPGSILQRLWKPDDYWSKQSSGSVSRYLSRIDESYGLPKGTTEGVWAAESNKSWNANLNTAGAIGPFQFKQATADQFHINPHSWSESAAGTAAQISYLARSRYNGDIQAAIAARMGVGAGKDLIRQQFAALRNPNHPWETSLGMAIKAHPNDWQKYLTPGESKYMSTVSANAPGLKVEIYNNTGGSATVVASQLAH